MDRRASTREDAPGSLSVKGQPVAASRRFQCKHRAESPVNQPPPKSPLLEQLGHDINRVALPDAAEVDLDSALRRTDDEVVGIELERRQPRADRNVEGAARQVEHVARDYEALQRRRADARVLARREMVHARDIAVGQEAAQFELEAIRRD